MVIYFGSFKIKIKKIEFQKKKIVLLIEVYQ